MKVSNERSYYNNVRIIVPVALVFLGYDLVKASFSGTIRYSSYSFRFAALVKEKIKVLIDFAIEDFLPLAMEFLSLAGDYLIFLIPIAIVLFLLKGPLLVTIEVNDEVVLLEKSWIKLPRKKKAGAPADHMVITRYISKVYQRSTFVFHYLYIEHRLEGEMQTLKFNFSRLNEIQRKRIIGKILSSKDAHLIQKESEEVNQASDQNSSYKNPKNPEHWKRVG